jgi:hypothetical protein
VKVCGGKAWFSAPAASKQKTPAHRAELMDKRMGRGIIGLKFNRTERDNQYN